MQPGSVQSAVEEVAPLVNDTDLLIAALSLTLCTTLLQRQPQQSPLVTDRVLPPAMTLSKSPLLQVRLYFRQNILRHLATPQAACMNISSTKAFQCNFTIHGSSLGTQSKICIILWICCKMHSCCS